MHGNNGKGTMADTELKIGDENRVRAQNEIRGYTRSPVMGQPIQADAVPEPPYHSGALYTPRLVPAHVYTGEEPLVITDEFPGHSTAIFALVFGVMGIAFPILFPVLAIVFGMIATDRLVFSDPQYNRFRTFAHAGMFLGLASLAANIVILVVLGAAGVYS